jgi:hypothetical protein
MIARHREIGKPCAASVLPSDDVVEVQRQHRGVGFGQPGELAAEARMTPHQIPQGLVQRGLRLLARTVRAFD